jgi:uncharacterized membrane protein YidH (DUF202 family)
LPSQSPSFTWPVVDDRGFVYRTRLAWTRTAITFVAAGLVMARLLVGGRASGNAWLLVVLLLVLMTLSAVRGYSKRVSVEEPAGALLLAQSLGLVMVALLAVGGLLLD